MNRKRIVALILAAVMALPSHVYAEPAAPGGADMPLSEETDVQAGMPETEDGQTEAPEVEESKEEAPVQDTGNAPADPAGSEELAEPGAPALDTGNEADGSEEDPAAGTEAAVGAGEGSEGDSAQNPAAVTYDLWIGGAQVTDQNLSGAGWTYDNVSKTLTLDNAELTATGNDSAIRTEIDGLIITGKGALSASNTVIRQAKGEKLTFKNAELTLKSATSRLIWTSGDIDIVDRSIITYYTEENGTKVNIGINGRGLHITENSKITINSCAENALKITGNISIEDSTVEGVSINDSAITAASVSISGKSEVKAESTEGYAIQADTFDLGEGLLIEGNAKENESKKIEITYTYRVTVEAVYKETAYDVGAVKDNIYTGYWSAGSEVFIWTGIRQNHILELEKSECEGIKPSDLKPTTTEETEDRIFRFTMPESDVKIILHWTRISDEPDVIGDFLIDANGKMIGLRDGLTSLSRSVVIPAEVTEIAKGVFNDPTKAKDVKEVSFKEGSKLTTIGDNAFENSGIEKITFNDRLERIGEESFASCKSLKTVKIPKGVKSIGAKAFKDCGILSEIELNHVETIAEQAFENCEGLTNKAFVLSEDAELTFIGTYAFRNCKGFTRLALNGATAKTIAFQTGAFEGCTGLTIIVLPEGLPEVPEDAFKGCISLETVDIPASVTAVRGNAFSGCNKLKLVVINNQDGPQKTSAVAFWETSFPNRKKELTLKGHGGTVKEHAETMGYVYESIDDEYEVSGAQTTTGGKIQLSTSLNGKLRDSLSASAGTKIYVRLIPDEGKWVRPSDNGVLYPNTEGLDEFKLESIEDNDVIYSFILQKPIGSKSVVINAKFGTVRPMEKPKVDIEDGTYDDYVRVRKRDSSGSITELAITRPGKEVKLILTSGCYKEQDTVSMPWIFELTSDDPKVASISRDGTLRSVGMSTKNTCTITVKSRVDKDADKEPLKVKVTVSGNANPETIDFAEFTNLARNEIIYDDPAGVPVIRFNRSSLTQEKKDFEVELDVRDDNGDPLIVPANWTVTDDTLVGLGSSTTVNNKNRIIVKKGAFGESSVNVTIKRTNKEDLTAHFIIQVVDATPRLKESTITVNSNSEVGSPFTLVEVYGYEIDRSTLVLKANDDDLPHKDVKDLWIDKNTGRIVSEKNQSGTFEKSILIEGQYTKECGGGTFRRVINKLVVTDKMPNPTLTRSGKINLFYQTFIDPETQERIVDEDAGKVVFKQNLKYEEVDHYELVSAEHYTMGDDFSGRTDLLANNFLVDKDKDGNAVVTRSDREPEMDEKNKIIATGYLYIYYDGYTDKDGEPEPVKMPITIPTATTKPSLALSATKATFSTWSPHPSYEIELRNKKTKKAIELTEDNAEVKFGEKTSAKFKNSDVFEENLLRDGKLCLNFKNAPVKGNKGKVVFEVRKKTWSKALNYTFNISVTDSLPKAKLSASTINFRTGISGQTAKIKVTWNQPYADMVLNSGNKSNFYTENGVAFSYEPDTDQAGSGTLTISADSALTWTKYKFNFYPGWKYDDTESANVNPGNKLSLTIKVTSKKPSMSLSGKGSLNLLADLDAEPLASDAQIVYKVKTGNINGEISDIQIWEYDSVNKKYTNVKELVHFEAEPDDAAGTIAIRARSDEEAPEFVKGGKGKLKASSYKIKIKCMINGVLVESKAATVKVTQKLPTLELDEETLTVYAGERYFPDKTHKIKLTKKTEENAEIIRVDWAKNASKARKDAFEIVGYDAETGILTLRLKNAARLKMNTEYTLPFVAVCRGQIVEKDTKEEVIPTGSAFSIKVTIKK